MCSYSELSTFNTQITGKQSLSEAPIGVSRYIWYILRLTPTSTQTKSSKSQIEAKSRYFNLHIVQFSIIIRIKSNRKYVVS